MLGCRVELSPRVTAAVVFVGLLEAPTEQPLLAEPSGVLVTRAATPIFSFFFLDRQPGGDRGGVAEWLPPPPPPVHIHSPL